MNTVTERLTGSLPDRAALAASALQVASAATLALPVALLYARAIADILLSLTAFLFLLRCVWTGDWEFLRRPWLRLALLLWAWLAACTLVLGSMHAVLEAFAVGRLVLFAAALEGWVLAEAATRRRLLWVIGLTAAWIAVECWQQYLLGYNLAGDPRWADGALTGPFRKPRAGGTFLVLLFPAVLPVLAYLLDSSRSRARLFAFLLLSGSAVTMVLIGQRMPALLMALGFIVSALLLKRFRLPMATALICAIVIVALTPVLSLPTFQKLVLHFLEQMRHFAQSNYGLLYIRAAVMLEAHPWSGLGFDGFREHCADPGYFRGLPWLGVPDDRNGGIAGCNLHPHNFYLELATDAGIPGLLLFVALVGTWLSRLWPGLSPSPLRVGLFALAVIFFWPFASTSALFTLPTGGWVFLMVGWGLAEAKADVRAASLEVGWSPRPSLSDAAARAPQTLDPAGSPLALSGLVRTRRDRAPD